MNFEKIKDNKLEITNLTQNEILALIKSQIDCSFNFITSEGEILKTIELEERLLKGNTQMITISVDDKKFELTSYSNLINEIKDGYTYGILVVHINVDIFKSKEPLIMILDQIKSKIIESCVYIDYNKNKFDIIFKPQNGLANKIHFFEDNNSVLIFNSEGPNLVKTNKIKSIEDILF